MIPPSERASLSTATQGPRVSRPWVRESVLSDSSSSTLFKVKTFVERLGTILNEPPKKDADDGRDSFC